MQSNRMNKLLDKIERRLGTQPLNLPDYLRKDRWATDVICNDTLDTFSRFFPNVMHITLSNANTNKTKDGYYLIDEFVPDNWV